MQKEVLNCETIEIPVNTSQKKYYLPTNSTFRGCQVVAMETFGIGCVSKTPVSGLVVANANVMKAASITLAIDGKERIKQLPLCTMDRTQTYGKILHLEPMQINNDKSFVELSDASVVGVNEAILITVYFKDKK